MVSAPKRGLLVVLGGNASAQLIGLLALPILSRLFTPEDFGYFSLIIATAGIIVPVVGLKFESASILAKTLSEVRAVVWSAIVSIVAVTLVFGIIVYVLSQTTIPSWAEYPNLVLWVMAIAGLSGIFSLLTQLSLRDKEYGLVARRTFLRSSTTVVSQVGLGFFGVGGFGLVLGGAVGHLAGISSMIWRTRKYLRFPEKVVIAGVWRKYWRFPSIFAPSALLNTLGANLPLIFFVAHFGIVLGGQLGMAERVVAAPIALIGYAVSQVVQAEMAVLIRAGESGLLRMYLRYSLILGAIGLLVAVGFGLLGGWVIPFILGDEWRMAGQIVQILAVTSGVRLIATALSKVLVVTQRAFTNLALDVIRLVLTLAAIATVLTYNLDITQALWVAYSALTLTYLVTWITGLFATRDFDRKATPPTSGEGGAFLEGSE